MRDRSLDYGSCGFAALAGVVPGGRGRSVRPAIHSLELSWG